jgi:serine protease Do
MARHVMKVLRTDGRVRRGQLGVTVQPVTSDLAAALGLKNVAGAVVSSVESGSAADRAGVKRGDVITSFGEHAVSDANALRNRVADAGPGSHVPLVVTRDGVEHRLEVELDEVKSQVAGDTTEPNDVRGKATLGVSVTPINPQLAAQVGVPSDVHGLLVEDVNVDSPAAEAGVQPGDVIQEVNRQPVSTVDQLRSAVTRPLHGPILLLVNRSGHELFLTARVS